MRNPTSPVPWSVASGSSARGGQQRRSHWTVMDKAKRQLTDSERQAMDAANSSLPQSGVPEDLALKLRNVGSRVRRHVSQGYLQPPSQNAFTKSVSSDALFPSSTNTPIFRSANETLRDVMSSGLHHVHAYPNTPRKRNRASSVDEESPDTKMVTDETDLDQRAVKPLPRGTRQKAKSEPLLVFGGSAQVAAPSVAIQEEEDWSSYL
ncbi:hypothetical protein BKA70DRAFT_1257434 [Coprinopsis sp. MPI-PUGE-AT-0042]|nr:hypothetical protein BKA70DRAFT_1257434 [Coprinopsis sp. MPI-PUGE-AT-0042]